jgi:hypothetical protein
VLEVLSHESETWTWSLQEHLFLFMDIRLLVLMDMISIDEIRSTTELLTIHTYVDSRYSTRTYTDEKCGCLECNNAADVCNVDVQTLGTSASSQAKCNRV